MDSFLIFLVIVAVAGNIALIVFFTRKKSNSGNVDAAATAAANAAQDSIGLKLILEQVNELSRTVDTKIGNLSQSVSDNIQRQFNESRKIVTDVTEKLTKLDETNKQVVGFADQLQNLQDILKNPKQRGILGEYYLETLLKNVLPPGQYKMQYAFENGEIVDAVVFVKDKIIPIDSKFSLENYNKMLEERNPLEKERLSKVFVNDLKLRIQETSKYIRPSEKTMDFAFMFIPHEAIYYDLLVNRISGIVDEGDNLIQRAASKYGVIIVSPTSFLAYLQTVLQGLNALQIEETAKDIIRQVGDLKKHLKNFEEYHKKLGASLGTVVNHFNTSNREFRKIDKDVTRIAGKEEGLEKGEMLIGVELIALEKPEVEE